MVVGFCALNGTEFTLQPTCCTRQLRYWFICIAIGIISTSQRNYASTTIWNEPLPLTLVGTAADPNHSSNLPVVMDPLMFLAGAVPTSLNAYPAAAAAASAIMPPSSELIGGPDGEAGYFGATAAGGLAAAQTGSRLSTTSSAVASGDRDYETTSKPSILRLLQTQNVSLSRVSRSLMQAAHALEVLLVNPIYRFAQWMWMFNICVSDRWCRTYLASPIPGLPF